MRIEQRMTAYERVTRAGLRTPKSELGSDGGNGQTPQQQQEPKRDASGEERGQLIDEYA